MMTKQISRRALAPVFYVHVCMGTGANARRLISISTEKLADLDELKQSLLQKAFTGQLTGCEEVSS